MNVINLYIVFNHLTARHLGYYFWYHFFQISFDARIQDTAMIFRDPDNMVLRAVCTMARKSCFHFAIVSYRRLFIHPRTEVRGTLPFGLFRIEQRSIKEKLNNLHTADEDYYTTANYLLDLSRRIPQLFESSKPEIKRRFINLILSNPTLDDVTI